MNVEPDRLDVDYTVAWDGDWHVGSGYGTSMADRLIRRRGGPSGVPFVPGSQVKGVLRHHCEKLAATVGCPVVSPHAAGSEPVELLEHFGPLEQSPLLIDRLFGSRYQGDCLFVGDALPAPDARDKRIASGRTRIALDRVSGTVKEGHLFVTEIAGRNGPDLSGHIRARHPARVLTPFDTGFPYEYALLIVGLLSLDTLGGDRSVGLGRCRVTIRGDALTWNGRRLTIDAALKSFADLGPDWSDWLNDAR